MNPTLREPEVMEVVPYEDRPPRVGDVALFFPPDSGKSVVHRIIRVTPAGISTLGDNNTQEDAYLLQPDSIQGRIVATWRGQKRRKIAGGWRGRVTRRWLCWRRVLDRGVSPLLHPVYQALSRWGMIVRCLPARCRPRVVVFQSRGRDQSLLLLGQRVIGRYDDRKNQWQIQRPFELFVDRDIFPPPAAPARQPLESSVQWRDITNRLRARPALRELTLADGSRWSISAGNEESTAIVSQLGNAMQLPATSVAAAPDDPRTGCRLLVDVDVHTPVADCYVPRAASNHGVVVCILSPSSCWGGPHANLVRLSLVFARESQSRGGVLIHGALAERDGVGIILAAPGGTGKTTASRRLPPPWRSLCDDTTLVVRDPQGTYRAHPWPTWSRFLDDGPGGAWDVQTSVPLVGVFILTQAAEDRVERVGAGQGVSLLVECVRQASLYMAPGLSKEDVRALYQERFDNLCAMARVIPVHMLHISLTGSFWREIDRVLAR